MRTYFYKLLSTVFLLGLVAVASMYFGLSVNHPSYPSARVLIKWQPNLDPSPDPQDGTVKVTIWEETFSRPIFSPTRRPFVPVPPAPEPVPPEAPTTPPESARVYDPNQLVLKGILMSSEKSLALISTPEQPSGSWIEQGSIVMGWKVEVIYRNSVVLSANGQSHALKQYVDNSGERLGAQPANP
jgi:type II secretory pathway component PulC